MRKAIVLFSLAAAGCASLPPEAAEHAGRLAQYHAATAEGALASYDRLGALVSSTVAVARDETIHQYDVYLDDVRRAEKWAEANRAGVEDLVGLLAVFPGREGLTAEQKAVLERLRERAARLLDEGGKNAAEIGRWTRLAGEARRSDLAGLSRYEEAVKRVLQDLRRLIVRHHAAIDDGLRRHLALFESYLQAAGRREEFWGKALGEGARELRQDALKAGAEYGGLLELLTEEVKARLPRRAPGPDK